MARLFIAGAALTLLCFAQPARAQQSCESLAGLKLPYATITSARMVAEGPFAVTGGQGGAPNAQPLKVQSADLLDELQHFPFDFKDVRGQHTAKRETKIVGQQRWCETVRLRCPQEVVQSYPSFHLYVVGVYITNGVEGSHINHNPACDLALTIGRVSQTASSNLESLLTS